MKREQKKTRRGGVGWRRWGPRKGGLTPLPSEERGQEGVGRWLRGVAGAAAQGGASVDVQDPSVAVRRVADLRFQQSRVVAPHLADARHLGVETEKTLSCR